jgi:hypothetical protein
MAAAVAAVVGGSALAQAQTSLQEAATLLRLNKKDEALAKLREILAADPSNADALTLYKSVSQDEWYMLMTHRENGEASEIQKIAQSILERARIENKARSRDAAAISALVATATSADSDYPTRQGAVNKLINDHGEFAVPALVEKLGGDDVEGQVQAIATLQQLRSAAVLPLIEVLKSSNALVVRNAAAALHHIDDARAIPVMAHLATDQRAEVASIAKRFLEKRKASGNAIDLVVAQGREYLKGNVPLGGFSEVVWSLKDDKLVPTDVLPLLYPAELAKACGATGVAWSPSSLGARSLVAQANLAQANLIETSIAKGDEAAKALAPVAAELKNTALAAGIDSLRAALDAGIADGLAPVAIGAIQALAVAETVDSIGSSSLLQALRSNNKQVRYAAATALVKATGGVRVPQAEEVVGVLAEAVTEESVRNIQVIAPAVDTNQVVEATGKQRGYQVGVSDSAVRGMRDLLVNPNVDVVVINEVLPDRMPEDVIGNMKRDPRMANAKVIVVAKDAEAAKTRFGDSVAIITAPLTGENLVAAVNTALEGVATPANERAEGFAVGASESLKAMAENKTGINAALTNLSQQLNRGDAVSVPAAKALGYAGSASELDALAAALSGSGSVELKKAAAGAIGAVLHRAGKSPASVVETLTAAMADADSSLRLAIVGALGRAGLASGEQLKLMDAITAALGPKAEEEKPSDDRTAGQ